MLAADKLEDKQAAQNAYLGVASDDSCHWPIRQKAAKNLTDPNAKNEMHILFLDYAISENSSSALLDLAEMAPALIKSNWSRIQSYAKSHHTDNPDCYHLDKSYSDCGHDDTPTGGTRHHADRGLGNKYLDRFPQGVKG
jgi:hypothetical protein